MARKSGCRVPVNGKYIELLEQLSRGSEAGFLEKTGIPLGTFRSHRRRFEKGKGLNVVYDVLIAPAANGFECQPAQFLDLFREDVQIQSLETVICNLSDDFKATIDDFLFPEGERGDELRAQVTDVLEKCPKKRAAPSHSDWAFKDPNESARLSLMRQFNLGFVGRKFVVKEIEQFLQNVPCGYFLIEGEAGVGKSALAAHLADAFNFYCHFNRLSLGIRRADEHVMSVCSQILGDPRFQFPELDIPQEIGKDGRFLEHLLALASLQLSDDERIVIVVDALDEVDRLAQVRGSNLLYLPELLPDHVYYIVTTRPEGRMSPPPFVSDCPIEPFDFNNYAKDNLEDIAEYVHNFLEDESHAGMSDWCRQKKFNQCTFVRNVVDASEGNFMFVKLVLDDIERQARRPGFQLDPGDVASVLPRGLLQYYRSQWDRMGMTGNPSREKLALIYTLAEADTPFPLTELAHVADVTPLDARTVLDEWSSFLHVVEDGDPPAPLYSLFHKSFRDFLKLDDMLAGLRAAGLSIQEINRRMATCWDEITE